MPWEKAFKKNHEFLLELIINLKNHKCHLEFVIFLINYKFFVKILRKKIEHFKIWHWFSKTKEIWLRTGTFQIPRLQNKIYNFSTIRTFLALGNKISPYLRFIKFSQ